jgi:DNA-binding transcriptional ArsR family regulator
LTPRSLGVDLLAHSGIRKALLFYLILRPRTPSELAAIEKKHVSHVSRALTELRRNGLVECSRSRSREKYYRATELGYATFVIYMRHSR